MLDRRLAAALVLAALSVPLARAQAREGPPAGVPAAAEARAVPSVLTLASGQHVRGSVRAVEGGYELEPRRGETRFLPAGAVARCVAERDLLASLRERDRSDAPAAVAAWALGEGLTEEALARLDRALAKDPSDAGALAVLDAHAPRLPLGLPGLDELRATQAQPAGTGFAGTEPAHADATGAEQRRAWIERALAAGARLTPAARELAARELARVATPDELGPLAYAELRRSEGARRAFGALVHARAMPDRNLGSLVRQTLLDPSEDARTGGALALSRAEDPRVLAALTHAFHSDHALLSLHAIAALGLAGNESAVPALAAALLQGSGGINPPSHAHVFVGRQRAYVQDFDVEVAQNEAIADPVINTLLEGDVLDVAVHSVNVAAPTRTRALRTALHRLTGSDPGATKRDWERWWAARQTPAGPTSG